MVKKCKQCGRQLTSGESNMVCEKCRKLKKEIQIEKQNAKKNKGKRKS